MPRFRFPLQPVLEQRQRAEERCQLSVAELERERLGIERAIRECQSGIERERTELRASLGSSVALHEARLQAAAAAGLDARARREALRLAGVLKRLEAARRELLAAATARKAVELLRDRRLEAWRAAEERRDRASVDELVVMRAGRKEDAP